MRHIPLEQPLIDLLDTRATLEEELLALQDAAATGEDVLARRQDVEARLGALGDEYTRLRDDLFSSLTPLDKVQLARHPDRPYALDYVSYLVSDWCELHGDRRFADDGAIIAGFGVFGGQQPIAVAGHQKGRNVAERKARNMGMPGPSGYRKAVRVMQLAGRLGHPVLTFIDTAGAACTPEAEELGISEALATSQLEMARLPVPVIATVIGEGGSGGAIALGVADHIIMLDYSYYSVISPEGCASIIWRDATRFGEAAEALRLSASDALSFGFCDEVLSEPPGGAHHDPAAMALRLEEAIGAALQRLQALTPAQLVEQRYEKFARMGRFLETA
ncbi:MAG: acetyl-CoA carboxylase carboxyltransferase subunit alpha [Fimbriimonadaceae bacterium]|nr:acetyl-CoA carboxylase carboxyltransferase subunit alpha [Fimbriimonadaceae bacterium]